MMSLPTVDQETATRTKLLLVEDDASVVASLKLFLKSDYDIYSASSVSSGVSLYKTLKPSLVVLDLRLPDGDGLDALREIRRVNPTVPVIVLTGYASMKSVEEALRLGASDYLHKPFDGFALKTRIHQLATDGVSVKTSNEAGQAQSLAKAVQRIAELELQAHASSMFLHDAAGPVTTALTSAHYLCQAMEENPERFDEDMQQMGELLHTAMGFISGLFEQSRSIKYLSQLPTANVAIGRIVTLAVNLVRDKARDRKVTITIHMQKPEAKVCVNQYALARVLLNLIRNAIEAVEINSGRVHLMIDAWEDQVECAVQDNGPGIPPRFIEQVFEARFTTKEEGMGLGLYICKHLVQSMNGTLAVQSEPGHGCRFSIKIPRVI